MADYLRQLEIERELRRAYEENFRDQYRTFEDFKRAYYSRDEEKKHEEKEHERKEDKRKEDEKKETDNPQARLAEAYALLGLTASRTQKELETQYRNLMKKVHPDAGGTQALAARVNQAKDLIMKQKGWK